MHCQIVDYDGPLGLRIRRARERRDRLIGVIEPKEGIAGTIQITDVAAGVRTQVPRRRLICSMQDAYRT